MGFLDVKYFVHHSAMSIQEIFLAIGQTIQEEFVRSVQKSQSFRLLTDDVTDKAVTEQLLLFVQYVAEVTTVQTKFSAVGDVLTEFTNTDAECLHAMISQNLKKIWAWKESVCHRW